MFDRVAGRYDLLNHVLSFQMDRAWRRRAARDAVAGLASPRVLDLCCGTGDLAAAVARAGAGARVVAGDFSFEMLRHLRAKQAATPLVALDALGLPFRDGSFDAVTVGFGVRNWGDRPRGFADVRRVLRPGGRFAILEFTPAPPGVFGRLYRFYSRHVLPRVASVITRDPSAYRYLPASVETFPAARELAGELEAAGFRVRSVASLAFGTVALHLADRPA